MNKITLINADVMEGLARLPDESVHMVCTSPPYWSLRDYGLEPQVWAGEIECGHEWDEQSRYWDNRAGSLIRDEGTADFSGKKDTRGHIKSSFCRLCGAWRGSYGLESTIDLYVQHTVEIFREVRRVLREDGVLFLNLGDTYAGDGRAGKNGIQKWGGIESINQDRKYGPPITPPGLKPKDLCGIPWRVALALQADGWWLRSDIIWAKPNPMPESCTDRPTRAHEYIFLLTKSAKYHWDQEAVKEPNSQGAIDRFGKNPAISVKNRKYEGMDGESLAAMGSKTPEWLPGGRNLRTVWTIATAPFPEEHFACVDAETEALTPFGWKTHDQLSNGDIIAGYDQESRALSWQPAEFWAYQVNCDLVAIEKRDSSQRLTENHRCLIRRRVGGEAIVLAGELKPGMEIPIAAPLLVTETKGPGKDLAALLGWYLTEGERKRHRIIRINQSMSANPEKVETIRSLLVRLGAEFSVQRREREVHGKPSIEITFSVWGEVAEYLYRESPDKKIDLTWVNWPISDIQSILDAMIAGDGHLRKDGRSCIVQKDRKFLDAVQMLALRLGLRTIISPRKEGGFVIYITKGEWLTLRGTNGVHAPVKREHYEGIIWCPSVESTFWIARRKGRTFITGNTYPPELVRRCVAAGTSERGACPHCGSPWRRVVEKKTNPKGILGGEHREVGRDGGLAKRNRDLQAEREMGKSTTTGWTPTCTCNAGEPLPCTVLDIFSGAGTTALVAAKLGRDAIGIEISPAYVEMSHKRIAGELGMLVEIIRE